MATYEYVLSSFYNGIDVICLESQIDNFGFSQTLNGILTDEDEDRVYIEFSNFLSQSEKEDLDAILLKHNPEECEFVSTENITGDSGDVESLSLSTTTTNIPQLKARMVIQDAIRGRYRIAWSYEYSYSRWHFHDKIYPINKNPSKLIFSFQSEIKLDQSIVLMSHIEDLNHTHFGGLRPASGFAYVNLDEGEHTIDLNYWANRGVSYIKNARLEIWRVA